MKAAVWKFGLFVGWSSCLWRLAEEDDEVDDDDDDDGDELTEFEVDELVLVFVFVCWLECSGEPDVIEDADDDDEDEDDVGECIAPVADDKLFFKLLPFEW